MLTCQSILVFIKGNIANVGYPPCILFTYIYKDILHSFHPKILLLMSEYRLLEVGELHGGLFLLKKRQPARGQCAWGQPSSSAVARVLQQPAGTCSTTGVGEGQFSNPTSWLSELFEHN